MPRPIDPRSRRKHRILYAAIALALIGGIGFMILQQAQTLDGSISVEAVSKNLGQDPYNIVVIDTRPAEQFHQGHVPYAMNVPFDQLGRRLGELASAKDRQVALIDDDVAREQQAMQILVQNGFRSVVATQGGMPAWRAANKPLATSDLSPH